VALSNQYIVALPLALPLTDELLDGGSCLREGISLGVRMDMQEGTKLSAAVGRRASNRCVDPTQPSTTC